MTSIFVPYISQKHIDHKYFLYGKLPNGEEKYRTMSCGIYPLDDCNKALDYSMIFELVMLYDKIILTKEDFLYLTTRIDNGFLRELLSANIINLVDTNSYKFGFSIKDDEIAFMTDKGTTRVGFSGELSKLSGSTKRQIERCTVNFDNDTDFIDRVVRESNSDLNQPMIKEYINLADMTKQNDIFDHNYRANQVFYMNYFYAMQARLNSEFIFQDNVIYELLKKKTASYIRQDDISLEDGFREILRLNDVIRVDRLVAEAKLSLGQLLELRESKDGKRFREWITGVISVEDTDKFEVIKAYHNACLEKGKIESTLDSPYYKTINTATSIGLGFIPIVGGAYTVFDNFKDYILKDWKPNCFINKLETMASMS